MIDGETDVKAPEARRPRRAAPKASSEWVGAADMFAAMRVARENRGARRNEWRASDAFQATREKLMHRMAE